MNISPIMGRVYYFSYCSKSWNYLEGQEVFIPIGVGIHLTRNKDLTYLYQFTQYSEKAGQIKVQTLKAFSSPFCSALISRKSDPKFNWVG